MIPPRSTAPRWSAPLLCAVLLVLAAATRLWVLGNQVRENQGRLPFSRESALQWWMTRAVAETGRLPSPTNMLQYPDEVDLRKIHSVGAEYVYAGAAGLLPDSQPLEQRVRWVSILLFCLSIPLLGLYARALFRGSNWALGITGALAAVCAANVARSSGVELSRENLSLPLFFAFLWLEAESLSRPRRWPWALGAIITASLAVCTWDMVLYGLGLWWVCRLAPLFRDGRVSPTPVLPGLALGLALAGLLNPYLRAHGFWHSTLVLGIAATAAAERMEGRRRWVVPLAVIASGLALNAFLNAGSYGHFGSLIAAKLRFWNMKPADPTLLTFDQRILWTPALNSSTIPLTQAFFPHILIPSFIGLVLCARWRPSETDRRARDVVVFFIVSLIAYVYFFRFHVFLIAWMAVVMGGWASWAAARGGWRFPVSAVVILVTVAGEAWHTFRKADPVTMAEKRTLAAQGAPGAREAAKIEPFISMDPAQLRFQTELVEWLGREHRGDPVLANFGISGPILAYAGCPVLLHPKFESRDIRERVREYAECLFTKPENALRDWAEARGAKWLVFSIGEFSPMGVDLQLRYMVNALDPGPETLARKLDRRVMDQLQVMARQPTGLPWDYLRLFRLRWVNAKYAVFRIVTKEDEVMALQYLEMARLASQAGDWKTVVKRTVSALGHDETLAEAFALKAKAEQELKKGTN